ncbi:uncharacterized protein [Macrobrachium rosenbergii]|uniref:uncharacterized protein n=1 Tax=Macrobrachium rosenbergii TaxID=79674 RepID=UPI0034D3B096
MSTYAEDYQTFQGLKQNRGLRGEQLTAWIDEQVARAKKEREEKEEKQCQHELNLVREKAAFPEVESQREEKQCQHELNLSWEKAALAEAENQEEKQRQHEPNLAREKTALAKAERQAKEEQRAHKLALEQARHMIAMALAQHRAENPPPTNPPPCQHCRARAHLYRNVSKHIPGDYGLLLGQDSLSPLHPRQWRGPDLSQSQIGTLNQHQPASKTLPVPHESPGQCQAPPFSVVEPLPNLIPVPGPA